MCMGRHFVKKLVVSDTVERFGEIDGEDVDIGVSREHGANGV